MSITSKQLQRSGIINITRLNYLYSNFLSQGPNNPPLYPPPLGVKIVKIQENAEKKTGDSRGPLGTLY